MKINEHSLCDSRDFLQIRSYHSVLSPQKRAYSAHHHTECELSVFLKGQGVYTVGKKQYAFSAGDVFLFGSDEEHSITEIEEEMDLLNVQFAPFVLWESPEAVELMALFNARLPSFENRFYDKKGSIQNQLLLLEEELANKRIGRVIAAKSHLFFALLSLIRDFPTVDERKAVTAPGGATQSIRLAMEYVEKNLDKDLALEEIAKVACLSPTYFSSLFKKFNGVSLWKYISIKRVERAIVLIQNESLTKLEIAERCGFTSSSNFYKAFTAITGKTPSDYARRG